VDQHGEHCKNDNAPSSLEEKTGFAVFSSMLAGALGTGLDVE
jgi:hypothetical protein